MAKATLFLILALAAVTLVSAFEDDDGDDPPMYAVHDYASGQLQARRTIKAQKACDADFGTKLEGIVTKMEKNKDADAEFANKLRQQFMDLMESNKDKSLCEKLTWCDMGMCQKRTKLQNRAADGAEPAPVPAAPLEGDVIAPDNSKMVKTDDKKTGPDPVPDSGTTTTEKSAAAREVQFFLSSFCQWATLTVIAILIPRNI